MTNRASAIDWHDARWLSSAAQYVLAAGIALLPLSWFVLHRLAGFSVKPAHLQQLVLYSLALLLAPSIFRGLRTLLTHDQLFWIAYTLYGLSLFAVALPQNPAEGGSLLKDLWYFGTALITAALIAQLPPERVMRGLWYGAAAALALFVLGAEMSLNALGESYVSRVTWAIRNANIGELMWGIHKRMFNSLSGTEDVSFNTSLRNTVASGIVAVFVILNIVRPGVKRCGALSRLLHLITVCASALLLVVLLSRSAVLAAGLSVACYAVLRVASRNVSGKELFVGLSVCAGIGLLFITSETAVQLFVERFIEQSASSYTTRATQYKESLVVAENQLLSGHGLNFRVGQHPVHNLFLASFVQGGLLCFLFSVLFYAAVLGSAIRYGLQIASGTLRWMLPLSPEWTVALTALPLTRVWVSGDNGQLNLAEWTALAIFYGIFALNRAACSARNSLSGRGLV